MRYFEHYIHNTFGSLWSEGYDNGRGYHYCNEDGSGQGGAAIKDRCLTTSISFLTRYPYQLIQYWK